jgi:hypothetical protein
MKKNFYKLSDILLLESDKEILNFRCCKTNLIVWPILRDEFIKLIISKLYYKNEFTNYNVKNSFFKKLISLYKLIKLPLFFKNLFFRIKKKDLIYVKSGFGNINLDNKIFDRIMDYFISLNKNDYISLSRSPEFSFFSKYFDKEIYFLSFDENRINLFSRFKKTNLKVSKDITFFLVKKIKKVFNIKINPNEVQRLISYNLFKINSIEKKLSFYKKLIKKIKPKLAIIEGASYSENAILNYALHSSGIRIAEPQHGMINNAHENYNFSSLIRNNKEYKLFLPDDFLAYGKQWSKSINGPFIKHNIGNPHKSQNTYEKRKNNNSKKILLVSDGINIGMLINLSKKIFILFKKRYEVFIRPHPIETDNLYKKHKFYKHIKIDNEENLYKSLSDKEIVISEMSTVLYDSLNIVPKIFILRTDKSKFSIPNHPFNEIKDINELIKKVNSNKTLNTKVNLKDYFDGNWKNNYIKYIKKFVY